MNWLIRFLEWLLSLLKPKPPEPKLLWDERLDDLGVTVEWRDGKWRLIAAWMTENGNWDDVPEWAHRWQQDTLGGDHHAYGRCEAEGGQAQNERFGLVWPGGGDVREPEPDGWANIPLAGQNWNPANGPGPYTWFAFGGDKLHGLGLPLNHHVSFFAVWQQRETPESADYLLITEALGLD